MRPKFFLLFAALFRCSIYCPAQSTFVPVPDSINVEGVSPIPAALAKHYKPYTNYRDASFAAWHPLRKEMLIHTRFCNDYQLHYVKTHGSDRKQITFLDNRVWSTYLEPTKGSYIIYTSSPGVQIHRLDLASGEATLLTDGGKTVNFFYENMKGGKMLYTSNRRNGTDHDLYMMDPTNPKTDTLIMKLEGRSRIWDWSDDGSKIYLGTRRFSRKRSIWLCDLKTGQRTQFFEVDDKLNMSVLALSQNKKGVYCTTREESEDFAKLVYYDLVTTKHKTLFDGNNYKEDVDLAELTKDGKQLAVVTHRAGGSKIYILNTITGEQERIQAIPTSVIAHIGWHNDNQSLAVGFVTANANYDVYEWNTKTRKLIRWTESELGGIDAAGIPDAEPIKWKSFDGREITGFKYRANNKFIGKRPVIINIHGGPDAVATPVFLGADNYYLNELGVTLLFPNVRGSNGFGKTFQDLDNGLKREDAVKDIGALLDWIKAQPDLDADRIMITGHSYGGYMSLACATHYSDKVRCFIANAGPSHFSTYLKGNEPDRRANRRLEYGDETDSTYAAFFEKIAPVNNAHKITKPLFLIHGKKDMNVPYTEAVQLAEKVKRNGIPFWFLSANNELHFFEKKENQLYRDYATIEFVKTYLLK